MHIWNWYDALVPRKVTQGLRKFADEKRIGSKDQASVKDVAQMVKQMPQYQKELNNYATHMHLAEDCMKEYQAKISNLCKVEQVSGQGYNSGCPQTTIYFCLHGRCE